MPFMNSIESATFHNKTVYFLMCWANATFWKRSYGIRLTALTWISHSLQTTWCTDYTRSSCCESRGALSSMSLCYSVHRKNIKPVRSNSVTFASATCFAHVLRTPILFRFILFLHSVALQVLFNLRKREIFKFYVRQTKPQQSSCFCCATAHLGPTSVYCIGF